MFTHSKSRGFTLIELLVVIAIIGILSSVVLASLNSARAKGADASVKSNLANIRAQAELYYDNQSGNNYGTAFGPQTCPTSGATMFYADAQVREAIKAAVSAGGGNGTTLDTSRCYVSADQQSYTISVRLKGNTSAHWCIDSSGAARQITSNLTWGAGACPAS